MSEGTMGFALLSRALLFASVCAGAAGCLGRADDLLDDVNGQLIITGAAAGHDLSVEIGDERREPEASEEDLIIVYLALPEGDHDGVVRLLEQPARCAAFSLVIEDARSMEVASVDVRDAPACADDADAGADGDGGGADPDEDGGAGRDGGFDAGPWPGEDAGPDAGLPLMQMFLHLEERLTLDPCLGTACVQVTRVQADGQLSWLDLAAPEISAPLPALDVEALAATMLSADADALFAGDDPDCAQPRPVTSPEILLERRYLPAGEAADVLETVGVAGCSGVAAELRARLSFLRQLAFGL